MKIRYTSFCCFLRPIPASSVQVCLKRQFFYINNSIVLVFQKNICSILTHGNSHLSGIDIISQHSRCSHPLFLWTSVLSIPKIKTNISALKQEWVLEDSSRTKNHGLGVVLKKDWPWPLGTCNYQAQVISFIIYLSEFIIYLYEYIQSIWN